ncbi:thiazole synthase [bacterium]|nr:thiazole synthase [bacterium]
MNDLLTIAGKSFSSRLLLGTASYPNLDILTRAIEASATQICTVAIRRINLAETGDEGLIKLLVDKKLHLLPNTAGCYTAREAVLTAKLAREALNTNWIKLEVIGDKYSLYPDTQELLKATEELVKDGFVVLPYTTDDPVVAKKLCDAGAAAVMPLGAPIGSGRGIVNPINIELIKKQSSVPVILDAGIGSASHAALAMELGCDAVLLNTAVANAQNPVLMAGAMKDAVNAGRACFLAGAIPQKKMATPSSPTKGKINWS